MLISRPVQSNKKQTGKIYCTVVPWTVCFDLKLSTLDSEEIPLSKMSLFCVGVVTRRLAAMIYVLRRLLEFCLVPSVLTFCMYYLCRFQASIRRCREMGRCHLLSLSCYMCHSHSVHRINMLNYITSAVDIML